MDFRLKPAKGLVSHAGLLWNFEILVVLRFGILRLNIFLQNLVRHIPRRTGKVSSPLQMPPPELLVHPPKLFHQAMACLALHRLHDSTRRHMRGHTQHQVHVIRPNMPFKIFASSDAHTARIISLARSAISPLKTGLRYFVINTKW